MLPLHHRGLGVNVCGRALVREKKKGPKFPSTPSSTQWCNQVSLTELVTRKCTAHHPIGLAMKLGFNRWK
jgi:hypothetical protein